MRWKKGLIIFLCSVLAAGAVVFGMSDKSDAKAETYYEDIERFPAAYRGALYALKEKHPNWTFEVMNTGLDWNTVVYNEMNPAHRSLVPAYFDSSFVGAYYGDGWSCATQKAVEYYLNPINWLTEDYIFQFEKLTYNENTQGIATVQKVLANTFMSGYIEGYESIGLTYAQAFRDIGASIGVSPVHLATRVYQEQGAKGSSDLISGTYPGYEGYYNYYNIQATGKEHEEIVRNGLNEAKSEGWNNRYAALYGGSKKVSERYILRGQDTLYLQKFDVDENYDGRYWHQYMQNLVAPSNEGRNIKRAYERAGMLDEAFVFKIPVYNNMPGILSAVTVEQGNYRIVSAINIDLVWNIESCNTENGANLQLWYDNGLMCQRYSIKMSGESYIIIAGHSDKSIDVKDAGTASGTNVQQWSSNGNKAQSWKFYNAEDGYVYIESECNNLYATVDSNCAGGNISMQKFTGADNQKFRLEEVITADCLNEIMITEGSYKIASAINSDLVWSIYGNSEDNGANLEVDYENGILGQRFSIKSNGEGYTIIAQNSGKNIDVTDAGKMPGINVQQWTANGNTAQNWRFYDAGDGYVYIGSECNDLYITLDGENSGGNISMRYFTGASNQKFKLEEVASEDDLNEIIISEGGYKVICAAGSNLVWTIFGNSADNGANLEVENESDILGQRFNIKSNGESYTIIAQNSGKNIDVTDAGKTPGINVQQWSANGNKAQNWKFYDAGDGYVYIGSECNDLYITLDEENSGGNISMRYFTGESNQKFKLEKVASADDLNEAVIDEGGYRAICATNSNLVWTIFGNSTDNGANLEVENESGILGQRFNIKSNGESYTIIAQNSGKNIDVTDAGKTPGINVQQWSANGNTAQNWKFYDAGDGYVYIGSECNDLYITLDEENSGGNISMRYFTGASNQKFKFEKVANPADLYEVKIVEGSYRVVSAINPELVWDIDNISMEDGANLKVWNNNGNMCQRFHIIKNGESYTITAEHSYKNIDVKDAGKTSGINVQQWSANGNTAQNWRFYDAGDGYVYIGSECNDLYISLDTESAGGNISMGYFTGASNQKFKLEKVE